MSLIRSWSNPEGMYIYESVSSKYIQISGYFSAEERMKYSIDKKCKYNESFSDVLIDDFVKAFRKYHSVYRSNNIKYGNIKMDDRWIHVGTGKIMKHNQEVSIDDLPGCDNRIVVFIKNKPMWVLWPVTCLHIANHVVDCYGKSGRIQGRSSRTRRKRNHVGRK